MSTPVRNILTEDSHPYTHMTVTTVIQDGTFDCHVLFVWGTRRGTYTTDRGLRTAIARFADEHDRSDNPGTKNDNWDLGAVHTRLDARYAAGESPRRVRR